MDAILALEDGSIFPGVGIGRKGITTGELVFNTAMTGYQEVITDPSYCNQIVVFTYPHIGNTGINETDNESDKIHLKAVIARNITDTPLHWASKESISSYLVRNETPLLLNIDTRALTKKLREYGSLNACIMIGDVESSTAVTRAKEFTGILNANLAKEVSAKSCYKISTQDKSRFRIAVIDYGVKKSIINHLGANGCDVIVMPYDTSYNEILTHKVHGVLLSNGPGDPRAVDVGIKLAKELVKSGIPTMGICLGYQILSIALGAKTFKMKFGHHGVNHPIKCTKTNKVFITSQNHGFAVDISSLPPKVIASYISLFDGTLQGIKHIDKPLIGFQGHPEAGPGPIEAKEFFQQFFDLMDDYKSSGNQEVIKREVEESA